MGAPIAEGDSTGNLKLGGRHSTFELTPLLVGAREGKEHTVHYGHPDVHPSNYGKKEKYLGQQGNLNTGPGGTQKK